MKYDPSTSLFVLHGDHKAIGNVHMGKFMAQNMNIN